MKTKILIVEDDPHILLGLEEVLKSDGFEVAACNRGDQATEAVVRHRPSLIVLDVMLPGKSGYDVCRELLARIHALLRRVAKPQEGAVAAGTLFQIGAATIDPKTFQLKRGKVVEELTAKELKLLQLFHAHAGEVLSRDRLLNEVWGYNYYGTTRTLDQVIVQLRKKLADNGSEPKHLLTVHGVGYKFAS